MELKMQQNNVEDWLMRQDDNICPSPHYWADDPEPEPESDEPSDEDVVDNKGFSPRNLKRELGICPICFNKGDPTSTLQCIKSHTKYFCFYCFATMRYRSEIITKHNREFHFPHPDPKWDSDLSHIPCPFRNWPGSTCSDERFHYMKALSTHILKTHIPVLDTVIEALRVDEDDKQCNKSHSSGYATMEDSASTSVVPPNKPPPPLVFHPMPSSGQSSTTRHSKKMPTLKTIQNKAISKLSNKKMHAEKSIFKNDEVRKSLSQPQCADPPPAEIHSQEDTEIEVEETLLRQAFPCMLCQKSFPRRAAMQKHSLINPCTFLNDKWCAYCGAVFEGFSILSCVIHLDLCRTSHRME